MVDVVDGEADAGETFGVFDGIRGVESGLEEPDGGEHGLWL